MVFQNILEELGFEDLYAVPELQNGYPATKRTLIADALFERKIGEEAFHEEAEQHRAKLKEATNKKVLDILADDEVELIWESSDQELDFAAVLECKGQLGFIADIVQIVEVSGLTLHHLESRVPEGKESNNHVKCFSLLLQCKGKKDAFLAAADSLAAREEMVRIKICKDERDPVATVQWFPTSVWDLDKCAHILTKYEPELDERHPGFQDLDYRQRRKDIAEIAFNYRQGDRIPNVQYTQQEKDTWRSVLNTQKGLQESHASKTYIKNFKKMEEAGLFTDKDIPQLHDVSMFMQKETGFQLRPAAGLLSARDFLSSLAFRVFQCTQYVRHHKCPQHTLEPDVVHELLGHVPMFVDPVLAQFSQEIGLASLGASDKEIEHLATLYWFTIEFGLCRENGKLRAYGAGLLSAYGELQHALSGTPKYREFEPDQTAVTTYSDENYQPLYYVAETIDLAMEKFRQYVSQHIKRPFSVIHNPQMNRIEVVRAADDIGPVISDLQHRMDVLSKTISALQQTAVKA